MFRHSEMKWQDEMTWDVIESVEERKQKCKKPQCNVIMNLDEGGQIEASSIYNFII